MSNRKQRRAKEAIIDNKKNSVAEKGADIMQAVHAKDFEKAKKLCLEFLNLYNKGNEAEKVAILLTKIDARNADAWNELGIVYFNNEKISEAGKAYSEALRISPHHGLVWCNYANALHKLGMIKEAIEFYQKSLEFVPVEQRYSVYVNMINLYLQQKDKDKALHYALEAYALCPNSASVHSLLGNVYVAHGNDVDAEKHYNRSLELEPDRVMVHANLGALNERKKNIERAVYHYEKVMKHYYTIYGSNPKEWPYDGLFKWHTYQLLSGQIDKDYVVYKNKNIDNENDSNYIKEYKDIDDRYKVLRLNNVIVVPDEGHIIGGDGIYYNNVFSVFNWKKRIVLGEANGNSLLDIQKETIVLDEPVIFLGGTTNYYHWVCDYLPRLAMLEHCPELDDYKIIVNARFTDFQKQSVESLGIPLSRFIYNENVLYNLKDAFFLHINGRPMTNEKMPNFGFPIVTRREIDWLHEKYAKFMNKSMNGSRRIFLSRRNAKFRICMNEDKIFAIAKEYGFERVENESLSFTEQIALYSDAQIVMGVHGAGFTNMAFAPASSVLIEMHPQSGLPDFYINLTSVAGQKHISLPGTVTQVLPMLTEAFWNFEVDPDKVSTLLKEQLG